MTKDISATQTNNSDNWCTPIWLYKILNDEFSFNTDVAATGENSLADFYFDEEKNGLEQEWSGTCYCNPPYSQLKAWLKKGYEEAKKGNATVVMLIAARTDTKAFWDYARHGEVRFLKGRLKFVGGKYSAPFPSAIVVFRKGMKMSPSTLYWEISNADKQSIQ